jgi:hypothetical protein
VNTLISVFLLNILTLHPVHVSYTSIDISTETGEVNLVCKFFTDDLKLLFYHYYDIEFLFVPDKELADNEIDLISRHLFGSFALKASGGNAVHFDFVRKEQNEESIWLYFHGKMDPKISDTLTLANTILLDLFEDQTNLVILTTGRDEKGYRFNYLTQEMKIEIKN